MVTIRLPDRETEKRALAFLLGRFSGRVLRSGEHLVPEAALEALADQNIPFTVKGKTTFCQFVRDFAAVASARSRCTVLLPIRRAVCDGTRMVNDKIDSGKQSRNVVYYWGVSEESKMKRIVHHPNVEWPPEPTGSPFAKGEEALPSGQGVLKEVVPARNSKDAEVEIILEHRGKDHHAWITIKNKDAAFASMLRSELGKCRGLAIDKIGEKEIAD